MRPIGFILTGYATLGCIPVWLTDGQTQDILIAVQAAALALGVVAHIIASKLKKNKS